MPRQRDTETFIPIDKRPPHTVRALIYLRTSNPSGSAADVQSQLDQCLDFVNEMRWTLIHSDDLHRFMETASGLKNVRRPIFDEVMRLIAQRGVDVIVSLDKKRLSRTKERRYHLAAAAMEYGTELRFVRYRNNNGKPPGGQTGLVEDFKDDLIGEQEAHDITERLSPGRLKRFQDGFPHGGCRGVAYGWRIAKRIKARTVGGREKGVESWAINEDEAKWVRWLYDAVDRRDPRNFSMRGLTRELSTLTPSPTGNHGWSMRTVGDILTDGKYAGKGRLLVTRVDWTQEQSRLTGRVYDTSRQRPARPDEPTYALSPEKVPPIVTAEQFDRVQAKLADYREHYAKHKRGTRRQDIDAISLLDGGYALCAHCGGFMQRTFNRYGKSVYYRCTRASSDPLNPCHPHEIQARFVDDLTLKLLAQVLTEPENVLQLADAAQKQLPDAETETELAEYDLNHIDQRLNTIATERAKVQNALDSLNGVMGMERHVAGIRADLQALAAEQATLEARRREALPRRQHAQTRQLLLKLLQRGGMHLLGLVMGEDWKGATQIPAYVALSLLGLPTVGERLNARLRGYGLDALSPEAAELAGRDAWGAFTDDTTIDAGWPKTWRAERDSLNDPAERELLYNACGERPMVEVRDVALYLLRQMTREEIRELLSKLEAVVEVSRPRGRAEYRRAGPTPPEERVTLKVMGEVEVRFSAGKSLNSTNLCGCPSRWSAAAKSRDSVKGTKMSL